MGITTYKKFEGESDEELIYRVCKDKEIIGSWQQVADILNELCGTEYTESKFRKQYATFIKMFNANQSKFISDNEVVEEMKQQRRELEQIKVQFRDERNAWNAQNRNAARAKQKLDYLEEQLLQIGNSNFNIHSKVEINSDNDMLIVLSDLHIGQTFNSNFGSYNSDIAKSRLDNYLNEILKIQKRHNSQNAYIICVGDLISGNLHKSIAVTNRENVIEQIKLAVEYISSFCYELTKHFGNVYFADCSGNHSRLDKKEDALHDERLDNLIAWTVRMTLGHIKNFNAVTESNADIGIANFTIRDKKYIAVHGDYDGLSKSAVSNLIIMLGYLPYACVMGHRHFPAITDESGVRVVQGGSLAGSGDDYTIEKRLRGKPSQTVCICTNNGIECVYPITFD